MALHGIKKRYALPIPVGKKQNHVAIPLYIALVGIREETVEHINRSEKRQSY